MKKHKCKECEETITWEESDHFKAFYYTVWAMHIHTRKIIPLAGYETLKEADSYVSDMKNRCTSHDGFFVRSNAKENLFL